MSPVARAILFKLGAVTMFIVMASLIKAASARVPPGEAVFFRSFFAIPVILAWIAFQGQLRTGLKTRNPIGHFWRGLVGSTAMGLSFAALGLLPLSEVKAIQYAQPVLVVVFAAMFLGENVRFFRMTAVVLGLAGVLVIMWPRLTAFSGGSLDAALALGAVVALASATFAALAHVFVRKLVQSEQTSAIVFWFSVTASSLSLLTIPFGWVVPTANEAVMLVSAGLVGGVGQIFLTASYRNADASVVAPFEYASILMALGIGYVVFNEVPTFMMLVGIFLIVAAGVLIIWRERQLGLAREKGRRAMTPQG
ncbi:MAG: DMT family transporter [Paracoccaceae bacterium]